ncbi:MAG: hypothetical protein ACYDDF_06050 [Thermoplasmatota archaeon]
MAMRNPSFRGVAVILLALSAGAAGCIGAAQSTPPLQCTGPSCGVVDPPPVGDGGNGTPGNGSTPPGDGPVGLLQVLRFTGSIDGGGTPLFLLDAPSSTTPEQNISPKVNGSMRVELHFNATPTASKIHLELDDFGTIDSTTGQPKPISSLDGPSPLVIDEKPSDLAAVKQLGFRVFLASGSVGRGVAFSVAVSVWNGTIPPAFTAFH